MATATDYAETVPTVWKDAADRWTAGFQRMFGQTPAHVPLPSVDPTGVFDQVFDSARRLLDMNGTAGNLLDLNREYVHNLTGAALSMQGAVREHTEGVVRIAREQVVAVVNVARGQAEGLTHAVRAQAQAVEQAGEEAARELSDVARQAEREVKREARAAEKAARGQVVQRYAALPKAELQDELARRDLPKTGTVDELRERLVDADLADAS